MEKAEHETAGRAESQLCKAENMHESNLLGGCCVCIRMLAGNCLQWWELTGWFFKKIPPAFSGLSIHMPVVGARVSYNTRQCDASLKRKRRSDMEIWCQPLRWCKIHPWCQEMALQNTSLSCPCLGGEWYLTPEADYMKEKKKWSLDRFWFSCAFKFSFLPIQVSMHSFYVSLKLL